MSGRHAKLARRQAAKAAHAIGEPLSASLQRHQIALVRHNETLQAHADKLQEHLGTINLHASVLTGGFWVRLKWFLFGVDRGPQPAVAEE